MLLNFTEHYSRVSFRLTRVKGDFGHGQVYLNNALYLDQKKNQNKQTNKQKNKTYFMISLEILRNSNAD